MKNNMFFKILSSIPVIVIASYFIPFLGICLLILRYIVYDDKRKKKTPVILTIIAFVVLIPQLLKYILAILKINIVNISCFYNIVDSKIYNANFIKLSKFLIVISVIIWILSYVFEKIYNKFGNLAREYIKETDRKRAEISQKNDLIMKEKRELAKNTHVVYCKYCGADNVLTSNVGTCKFCRRKIQ